MELLNSIIPLKKLKIKAIAIGGGTPIELSTSQLQILLENIKRLFSLPSGVEYTIEINPHNIRDRKIFGKKLAILKEYSVNRLSFGVQSFNDRILKANGSRHTSKEAKQAFYLARKMGFKNINIDIIAGLRKESHQSWLDSCIECCRLKPEHITVNELYLSPESKLWRLKKIRPNEFLHKKEMRYITKISEAIFFKDGFGRTVRSNYVNKSDNIYLHEKYTFDRSCEVIGFGASAVSWVGGACYRNVRDVDEYGRILNEENSLPIDTECIYFPSPGIITELAKHR